MPAYLVQLRSINVETAITQAPSARRAEARSMPESRVSGRSEATSIDGAEHGAILSCVMA